MPKWMQRLQRRRENRKTEFTQSEAENCADVFFTAFQDTLNKQFKPWVTGEAAAIPIAGDKETSQAFARWVVNDVVPDDNATTVLSTESGHECRTFHLKRYIQFISGFVTRDDVQKTKLFTLHRESFQDIAQGEYLWTSETKRCRDTSRWMKANVVASIHSTHHTERSVRDASIVATTGRGEEQRNAIVTIRYHIDSLTSRASNEADRERKLRANQHVPQRKKRGTEKESGTTDVVGRTARGSARASFLLASISEQHQRLGGFGGSKP
jgi:hypothetical protein